jgi:hypothetical protein
MSGFATFYLIALIPSIVGAILFICDRKINWMEWLGGTAIAFFISGIMHFIAINGMVKDVECWSGQITNVSHFPQWVERYQVAIYRTETYYSGSGKNRTMHTRRVFDHYETRYDTHHEHWEAFLNFGTINEDKDINFAAFNEIKANFGGQVENGGIQSTSHGGSCSSGDNKIYTTYNKTGYIYPVTTIQTFENRIKAAPTVFSFVKVPTNVPVYEWPTNPDWLHSDRLIGESRINLLEFDRMNARLGPIKKVNVIFINFGIKDRSIAEQQKSKWIGGKKNDLVFCYGQIETNNIPSWSMIFGWSNSEICKRDLETILLSNPINNDILPVIEKEIRANYVIKDWSSFDYIQIEPPIWSYIVLIIVMILTQTGFWAWANLNDFSKD